MLSSVHNIVDPLSPLLRAAIESAKSLIPLKSLRHGFLEDLFLHVVPQSVFSEQVIFESDSYDGQVIYLSSGSVKLEYGSGRSSVIHASEAMLPLANEQPRPCKAIALEDSTILRIDADRLDRTLSWSQITDYVLTELAMNRQHDGDLEWMTTVLASNLFFKVPSVNAEQIFARLTPMVVSAGELILQQGDIGDCCYFLKEGRADIIKHMPDEEPKKVAEILAGRCFGEDALVEKKPRNADVVMATDGLLVRLEKSDFLTLLEEPVLEELKMSDIDVRTDNPILVDVRTDAEYHLGHLAYSANVPLSLLAMKKRLLNQEQLYVMYCDTGRRSRAAAYFLGKQGYNVVSLQGGIQAESLLDRLVESKGYILRDGALLSVEE